MEVLSEIEELEPLVQDIKQRLVLEGASFDGMYMHVYVYKFKKLCICILKRQIGILK